MSALVVWKAYYSKSFVARLLVYSSRLPHRILKCVMCSGIFFFFSSRRRHTRFKCDWSSNVCSSDLGGRPPDRRRPGDVLPSAAVEPERQARGDRRLRRTEYAVHAQLQNRRPQGRRSEERRVGKECRSRWSPDH